MNTVTDFMEFNLHANITKAITACGYTKPTPVQAKSIPLVMNRQDVVVSAQTGTGKTASFVLPALHYLSSQDPTKKTRVLILTPTRELASQIIDAARKYSKFMNKLNLVSLIGGMPYHNQIKDLGRGADIIVATPGRLMDHIEQKRVDLSNIDMLVLDEADRMLDMGFIDDVQYIAKLTPSTRQTLLFSATLDNKLMNAVKHLLKNPARIDLSNDKVAAPQIQQEMYKVNNGHQKARLLKQFLRDQNIFKAIIFSATKINADRIADELCDDGFAAAPLHGDLRQNARNRTLEKFRSGRVQYLIATDVAARGIDISDITHVFNYDLPRFCEDYVHRIGRTGRAGKTGIAISFVLPTDSRHLQSIERYTGQRIKLMQNVESKHSDAPKAKDDQEILTLNRRSNDDREERYARSDRSFRSDRNESRGDRGDRPFRSSESRDGGARRFDRDDRAPRSEGSRDGGFRKPFADRGDRPARTDSRDSAPRRFDRDDRPARTEGRDRKPFSSDRGDRPMRTEGREGFRKPFADRGDRPARAESRDGAPRRFDRDDRPARSDSKEGFAKKRFSGAKDFAGGDKGRGRSSTGGDEKRGRFAKDDGNRPFKKRSISKDEPFSKDRKFAKKRKESAE